MSRPNRIAERFLAELDAWLTPDLLYHCFTGENDPGELDRIAKLDHVLRSSLLEKVERLWPARLEQIAAARKRQRQQDKADVQQFVLKLTNVQNH
jgi:hypothetical protein